MQVCRICNSTAGALFTSTILRKYEVTYWRCASCEYIFTDEPFWLDEAYSDAINMSDTGQFGRNIISARITAILCYLFLGKETSGVDWGGGYGVFTRLMRDYGFNWFWQDSYCENLFAKGFELQDGNVDVVSAFEVLEHVSEPKKEIEKMLSIAPTMLFSTELIPEKIPTSTSEWWYFSPEHGQHISFYSKKTLQTIADEHGLTLYSNNRNLHLFTRRKFPKYLLRTSELLAKVSLDFWTRYFLEGKTGSDMHMLRKQEGGRS